VTCLSLPFDPQARSVLKSPRDFVSIRFLWTRFRISIGANASRPLYFRTLFKKRDYAFALDGFRKADKQDGGACVSYEIKA
jgi:hypothetical protein